MVNWSRYVPLPAAPSLYVPDGQKADTESVRLALVFGANPPTAITIHDAVARADVRLVAVCPGAGRAAADWQEIANEAATLPPRTIVWQSTKGLSLGNCSYLVLDGMVVSRALLRWQCLEVELGEQSCKLDLSDQEQAAWFTGPVSFRVGGKTVAVDGSGPGGAALRLDMSPSAAGQLTFHISPDETALAALRVECRYFVKGDYESLDKSFHVDAVRFPVFAPGTVKVPLSGLVDLAPPVTPGGLDGLAALFFEEGTELPSYLFAETGESVTLRATKGAALVSVAAPSKAVHDALHSGDDRYFTPSGTFVVVQAASPSAAVRVLTGSTGTEYVELPGAAGSSAPSITFELGDAYVPVAPWWTKPAPSVHGTSPEARLNHQARGLAAIAPGAQTAWVRFSAPAGVKYFSQPQRAPLFRSDAPQPDQPVPHYRFAAAQLAADLAIPVAPIGASSANGTRDPLLLVSNAIAPARLQRAVRTGTPQSPSVCATTPQGFLAHVQDARWTSAGFATTPLRKTDQATQDVTLEVNLGTNSELATELLQPDVLLAASRWEAGVNVGGGLTGHQLAIDQWGFNINVPDAEDAAKFDPFGGITFFKFHSGTLLDVINDPRTYSPTFHADPSAAQARVKELIRPALADSFAPEDAPFLGPLRDLLNDPHWTGVVAFNATITQAPSELAGLIGTMPDTLRLTYLAIPINRVAATLEQRAGSLQGLLDYSDPTPPTRSPFDFKVSQLRVAFAENTVTAFRCRVSLKTDQWFFANASSEQAPGNVIDFEGRYEAHGPDGGPTYTFESDKLFTFTLDTSAIESISISHLRFVTESQDDVAGGERRLTSRVTLRGSLKFGKYPVGGDGPLADFFSFDAIGFDDLTIEVVSKVRPPSTTRSGDPEVHFRAGGLWLDASAGPRTNSFLAALPLKLKGFLSRITDPSDQDAPVEDIWGPRGFLPMVSPDKAAPNFALVFTFDLGSLGPLSQSLQGLSLDIALGWTGSRVSLAVRLPQVTGGERAFGIEGILRILAKDFQFTRVGTDGPVLLLLREAQLEILGHRFPASEDARIGGLLIADPAHPKAAWLATAEWPPATRTNFIAIGQRLAFTPRNGSTTDTVTDLQNKFRPYSFSDANSPPQVVNDIVKAGAPSALSYDANNDWILALRWSIKVLARLQLDLILDDPSLYGVHVRLGDWDLVDLQYRRVSEGLGMFHVEMPVPGLGSFDGGPLQLTLPNVGLGIFTDGGFRVDLGFPNGPDFSRSFHLSMPPFTGAGGFYFARLVHGGSDLLPTPNKYSLLLQAGIGFKVGYYVGFSVGPFSASASISVYALLEGAAGFPGDRVQSPDLALRGEIGLVASLRCHLDLILTALDFSLDVWVGIQALLQIVDGHLLPVPVTVVAGVRVTVVWVIARFKIFGASIEITVTLHFEATIQQTFWLGGGNRSALARRAAMALASPTDIWDPTKVDPVGTKEPLSFLFAPEVIIGSTGAPKVVGQLLLERSALSTESPPTPGTGWSAYDILLRRLLRWAARARNLQETGSIGDPTSYTYTVAQLKDWANDIGKRHSCRTAGLTYDTILQFLALNFDAKFASYSKDSPTIASLFPVFSELELVVQSTSAPFSSPFDVSRYSLNDEAILEAILDREAKESAMSSAAPPPARPLASLLVEEFFEALVKSAVHDLSLVGTDAPATLDTLIDRLRHPHSRPSGSSLGEDDDFAVLASTAGLHLLHGVHIPAPTIVGPGDPTDATVYARTGQMAKLVDALPPTLASPWSVTLKSAPGFVLGDFAATARIDDQGFQALSSLDALMPDPATAPVVPPVSVPPAARKVARSFALAVANTLATEHARIARCPDGLLAVLAARGKPFPVKVVQAVPAAAKPGDAPTVVAGARWLLRVDVKIRRSSPDDVGSRTFEVLGSDAETTRRIGSYLDRDGGAAAGSLTAYSWRTAPTTDVAPLAAMPAGLPVLCVVTNVSRRANPGGRLRTMVMAPPSAEVVTSGLDDVDAFLRQVWKAGIVRDGGFTLALPVKASDILWDAGTPTIATLTFIADLGDAQTTPMPSWANAVLIPGDAPPGDAKSSPAYMARFPDSGDPQDADGWTYVSTASSGRMLLELVRPNPDTLRAAIPSLHIQAGLSHADLLAALHAAGVDPTSPKWAHSLWEARDPQVHLQLSYRLLSFVIAQDKSIAARYRQPVGPRFPDEPTDEKNWTYRRQLDLVDVAGGGSPYALVGSNLDFSFGWRDGYGNDAPGWGWQQSIPVEYQDAIVPVDSWPGIVASWLLPTSHGGDMLVRFSYSPSRTADPGADRDKWKMILEQLHDDKGLTIGIGGSFCSMTTLPAVLRSKLVAFLESIAADPHTTQPACDLPLPLPQPSTGDARTLVRMWLNLSRESHVDATTSALLPQVQRVESPLLPDQSDDVDAFAKLFEACFPTLVLALGEGETDAGGAVKKRAFWAVSRTLVTPTLARSASAPNGARYFAPAPLSTGLISIDNVPTADFDPTAATGSRKVTTPLRGQDPDVLMRSFLDDLEAVLRPEVFTVARQIAASAGGDSGHAMDDIVRHKDQIATSMRQIVCQLLDQPADPGQLSTAQDAYADALQRDLRQAYQVDTVMQFDLAVTGSGHAELLYGDIVSLDGTGADMHFSRGRAWLCPNGTSTALSVLVAPTNKDGDVGDASRPARLGFQITHIARPDDGICGDTLQKYRSMRWLEIVRPLPPVELQPKNQTILVPFPLRVHPSPPTILHHAGVGISTGPGASIPDAARWTYEVTYAQDWLALAHGYDTLTATVQFERYAAAAQLARTSAMLDGAELQTLVAWLGAWKRSAAAVLPLVDRVRTNPPTSAGDDVFKAYAYVQQVSAGVAHALGGAALRAFSVAAPTATVVDIIDEVPMHGGSVTVNSGRTYVVSDPPSGGTGTRSLSVGTTGAALDVRSLCSATATLVVTRNAHILGNAKVNDLFVYQTDRVSAGEPVKPSLNPDAFFRAAPAPRSAKPSTGATRQSAIASAIAAWLGELAGLGPIDLSVRVSYAFDQRGSEPQTVGDLASCAAVPIFFVPERYISGPQAAADIAATLAKNIDSALPSPVPRAGAGVLVEIVLFTHGETAERPVLRLRGLWIPLA